MKVYGCFQKIGGKPPKWSENNGSKPYEQMDDLGGFYHYPYGVSNDGFLHLHLFRKVDHNGLIEFQDVTGEDGGAKRRTCLRNGLSLLKWQCWLLPNMHSGKLT